MSDDQKYDFSAFDDSQDEYDFSDFDESSDQELPDVTQTEAALSGAKQGLTMGFADEAGAGIQSNMDRIQRLMNEYTGMVGKSPTQVNEDLAASGTTGDIGPTSSDELYDEAINEERATLKAAEEQHPGTFMAADVAGSFLTPVPGATAAKVAGKVLPKVAKAAKGMGAFKKGAAVGTATGGVEALGRTEEDGLSMDGLIDAGTGAVLGGALGGAVGKVASKLSKSKAEKLAEADILESDANRAALKGIGAKMSDFQKELGTKTNTRATAKTAKGTGTTLLDEDVLKVRQNADEVKESIVNKLDEVGSKRIAPAAAKLDELSAELPVETFAEDLNKFAQKSDEQLEKIAGGADYARSGDQAMYNDMNEVRQKLFSDIESSMDQPNKISQLVDIKRKLQSQINWKDPQATSYNEFLVKMQSNVSELIDGMGKKIDPAVASEMKEANKVYSNLLNANKVAGDEMAREIAKEGGLGFKDYLASGVISGVTAIPGLGPAVVAGKKVVEKVSGKDTGKLLNTFEAFQKTKKAANLRANADKQGMLSRALGGKDAETAAVGVASTAAALDEQTVAEPYKVQKDAARYAEKASPEELQEAAVNIRDEYGKAGEGLAMTLDKIAERDPQGRRALIFSVMQDPVNRKMLGLGKDAKSK